MTRKLRTYKHKGKIRTKYRLPRKQKKARKKRIDADVKKFGEYIDYLKAIHGDDWHNYVILGG